MYEHSERARHFSTLFASVSFFFFFFNALGYFSLSFLFFSDLPIQDGRRRWTTLTILSDDAFSRLDATESPGEISESSNLGHCTKRIASLYIAD